MSFFRLISHLPITLLFAPLAFAQNTGQGTEFGLNTLKDIFSGAINFVIDKLGFVFGFAVNGVATFLQTDAFHAALLVLIPVLFVLFWKIDWFFSLGEGTIKALLIFLMIIFALVGLKVI